VLIKKKSNLKKAWHHATAAASDSVALARILLFALFLQPPWEGDGTGALHAGSMTQNPPPGAGEPYHDTAERSQPLHVAALPALAAA
jgi:hypothetical protein